MLEYFKKDKENGEIKQKIEEIFSVSDKDSGNVLEKLVQANIIVKPGKKIRSLIKKRDQWFKYGWGSSFYYHLSSRDFEFLDYSKDSEIIKDQRLMENYLKEYPSPSAYKEYRSKKFYPLVNLKMLPPVKFPPNLKRGQSLDKEKLSYMMNLVFGEQFSAEFPVVGKFLAKTSPSGGARHPSEAYLLLLRDVGIPAGIYHYSVKRNGLELLSNIKNKEAKILRFFYKTTHVKNFNAEAIIVISSLFERNMWRYREIRTFRVIFLDIGHLLSTLRIIIKSLGMEVLINHSFDDVFVQKLLNLTTGKERPLYCAIVGNYKMHKKRR